MSLDDKSISRNDTSHSSIPDMRHAEKTTKAGEFVPASAVPKRSPFLTSVQQSLLTASEGFSEDEYFSNNLKPTTSSAPTQFFGNIPIQRAASDQALSLKTGTSIGTKSSETLSGVTVSGAKAETVGSMPGSDQSLLAIILAILDQIMTSQSKTQAEGTMASAKMVTQEYTLSTQAAESQYKSDLTNANIEFNNAIGEIVSGSINVVTGIAQGVLASASFRTSFKAMKAPEAGDTGEELPIEKTKSEELEERPEDAEGAAIDEASGRVGEPPVNEELQEEVQGEEQAPGEERREERVEREVKEVEKGNAPKKPPKDIKKTKKYLEAKAERLNKYSAGAQALGTGVSSLTKGFIDYSNSLKREVQAAQTAKASYYRAACQMIQAAQQATQSTAQKSGDIAKDVLDVVKQAFRSVVDLSTRA